MEARWIALVVCSNVRNSKHEVGQEGGAAPCGFYGMERGIKFVTSVAVGEPDMPSLEVFCEAKMTLLLVATGATVARDLPISNRNLNGIHFAMQFLHKNTKSLLDSNLSDGVYISAKDKHVIVIGGGDTGNDCIGTSVRHGAKSITNFELLPQPPSERARDNPWPQWPRIYRVDYGHSEVKTHMGKDPREYCVMSKDFVDDGAGNVKGINTIRVEWTRSATGGWDMKQMEGSEQSSSPPILCSCPWGFLGPVGGARLGRNHREGRSQEHQNTSWQV